MHCPQWTYQLEKCCQTWRCLQLEVYPAGGPHSVQCTNWISRGKTSWSLHAIVCTGTNPNIFQISSHTLSFKNADRLVNDATKISNVCPQNKVSGSPEVRRNLRGLFFSHMNLNTREGHWEHWIPWHYEMQNLIALHSCLSPPEKKFYPQVARSYQDLTGAQTWTHGNNFKTSDIQQIVDLL